MSSYTGTADSPDRAKAIAAVARSTPHSPRLSCAGSTSRGRPGGRAAENFRHRFPPPPPPHPRRRPRRRKGEKGGRRSGEKSRGLAGRRVAAADPAAIAIPAAKVAGTGSATTSGAGTSGTGTGAGGSGNGPGGGGNRRIHPGPAITQIPDSEYRRLAATGMQAVGSA